MQSTQNLSDTNKRYKICLLLCAFLLTLVGIFGIPHFSQTKKLTTKQKLKLYLSVGSLERGNKDKCEHFFDKQEVMNAPNAAVIQHKSIESKFEIFEGYDHQHAYAVGLIMGMNYIFVKNSLGLR